MTMDARMSLARWVQHRMRTGLRQTIVIKVGLARRGATIIKQPLV